jgi:hypothetical protein
MPISRNAIQVSSAPSSQASSCSEKATACLARSRGRCKGARPNHVGMALARHKRAGRIEERDGKLYATQSTGTVQRAAI